ncbi:response regulator [Actinoplanes sp. TBRC 11911]|nr:response regulator [Actinoplanes sp. TBRC 11911]
MIAEVIRRLGHDVVVASDGRDALAAVREHRPRLVVADIDMPHLDGFELCRAVREDPALSGTPVVLVTAYLLPGDPRLAATGARAVIGKPFSVPELSAALRAQLEALDTPPVPADGAFIEALLNSLDSGVAACDASGRLVVVNSALRDYIEEGAHLDVLPGMFGLQHHDGTPMRADEMPLARALAGEEVNQAELLGHDGEGRQRWYAANARPIRAGNGPVTGAVVVFHDNTNVHRSRQYQECKAAVLKVLAEDSHAPKLADRILDAIGHTLGWPHLRLWLADEVTDLLRPAGIYTAAHERPLPIPASMTRGQGLAGTCWDRGEMIWVPDVHAPDSPVLPKITADLDFAAAGAVPVRSGHQVVGVLTFFTYARQEPDPALGLLLTGIAGLIGAFLEHRRAEVLAMHLAVATDEYIALVGHELRTPLTSIGAYVDLMAEFADDTPLGEVRDLLDVVQRNNLRLRDLVERLLDLAGLESGQAVLAVASVDLVELVGAAIDAVSATAAERGIKLDATMPGKLTVPGDRERLRQVTDALLGNAVKFSHPDSTVMVTVAEDGPAAELTVADTGVGIPAAEQVRLFRRLYRGGNARHTGIPGAGLGLALSRVVVERHHGTITLASDESNGTAVTVRLPRS